MTKESLGSRLASFVSGGLVRVFLIVVGLFWLVPTVAVSYTHLTLPTN